MASSVAPRRWPRRLVVTLLVVLLTAVLGVTVGGWLLLRAAYPDHAGEVRLADLDAEVEARRDERGVPYLLGDTSEDLYRAQGFVHAQDRFWQMETMRHITAGRTAELFGPEQRDTDRFLRTLGWHRVAEEEYAALDDEHRGLLDAYADGVNAYLEDRAPHELGVGFPLLRLTGVAHEPEPWHPRDTLAYLKLMAWELGGNLEEELERAVLARTLDDDEIAELFPEYPEDVPRIVPSDPDDEGSHTGPATPGSSNLASETSEGPGVADALARAAAALEAGERALGPVTDGIGSNAWVVGGEHTSSGAPLLANDPHIGVQSPAIWYEVGLRCRERTEACADDVTGFSFPGVPGVVIGHNDSVAWGFTNLDPDVQDLFVERVDPDDPTRYETGEGPAEAEVLTEELHASDGSVETLEIRVTRNGPIISDAFEPLDELDVDGTAARAGEPSPLAERTDGEAPTGTGGGRIADPVHEISLRWTALEPTTVFEALPAMNRARDLEEFREAAARFEVPAQNLVYADTAGTIAYQAPGTIPVRGAGDGTVPAPGWDDAYQWQGSIPFDELPREADPDRGWIVTANNPVPPEDYPWFLSVDDEHGYRAGRIIEMLQRRVDAGGDIDVAAAAADQLDTRDGSADFLVPHLLALDSDAPAVAELGDLLDEWDGRAHADSAGAAAYAATWRALLSQTFGAYLPEAYQPEGNSRWFEVVRRALEDPGSPWWDHPDTPVTETRDDALENALATAWFELRRELGTDPDDWRWGDLHTVTFVEGTLGESGIAPVEALFNRGPYPVDGGTGIVNATSWAADEGYEVRALPSMRMVVDLGDLDQSTRQATTGQSGHPGHRHYSDTIDAWLEGEQFDVPWSEARIEDATVDRLRLQP
ncbi:penicillin acylase family protein [Egibacter rhizosphaerae]|uniref:penicillin acylase family protein n=1 Tax=Egibacter rhizosphaerae TaxID=1670831 RepID=UPI0013F16135|nr:penicillin acylase family protein [Egibacter rhizosphaerae]